MGDLLALKGDISNSMIKNKRVIEYHEQLFRNNSNSYPVDKVLGDPGKRCDGMLCDYRDRFKDKCEINPCEV